jgi:hypothetical protein
MDSVLLLIMFLLMIPWAASVDLKIRIMIKSRSKTKQTRKAKGGSR